MAKGLKTGGRIANTPNKITRIIRESLIAILSDEVKRLPDMLSGLSDRDRIVVILKLLPLILPKQLDIEDLDNELKITLIERFRTDL